MTNTALTEYELGMLRHLDEVERNLDPCNPVPHPHYEQVLRSLLRKGLVTDYYWSVGAIRDQELLTAAGRELLASLRLRRLPIGCYGGCDRVRGK